MVSHRSLQIELPDDVAALIRKALVSVPAERLLLSSDCGFGRQGMSRTHAFYKMIAMVRGANIVRRELGLPEADIPATAAGSSPVRVGRDERRVAKPPKKCIRVVRMRTTAIRLRYISFPTDVASGSPADPRQL